MDAPVHVRVCPECEDEFRPDVLRCSSCDVELKDRWLDDAGHPIGEAAPAEQEPAPSVQPPRDGFSACATVYSAGDARQAASLLESAGVDFDLRYQAPDKEYRSPGRYTLFVAGVDRARALEAVRPVLGHEGQEADVLSIEYRFSGEGGYTRCPACDASIEAGSRECAECGLTLASDDES